MQGQVPPAVPEDELVSTLKQLVSEKLNVPVRQQRLLFKGKALAGTQGEETPREPRRKRDWGARAEAGSRVTGRGAGAKRHMTPREAAACLTAGCRSAPLPPPEAVSRPGPPPRRRRRRNPSICLWQMGNDSRIIASGPTPSST
ncbi:PREDICTED: ubiquitin-like protein 4A [Colobus angolensis palliatus]|uniref:ubiquitin-like protein 4A n=1 Tax=Colobus angolensis palliatus TaxID=336983 RepID=UPI0005F4B96C|nr:PREDICTED: ubiquitin-like protein 4A [Colobus angolensis palliatus]